MQNVKKFLRLFFVFIIIILVGIMIYKNINKKVNEEKYDNIKTNMLMIEGKVKIIKAESEANGNQDNYVGTKVNEANNEEANQVMKNLQISEEEFQNYYILNKESFEKMGMSDSIDDEEKDCYIVNYDNSEVIYIKGIDVDNEIKYRLSDIENEEE